LVIQTVKMFHPNHTSHNYVVYFPFFRAHETANEARRVNKQLKECQTQAQTFNSRERLFNMPVTSVSDIWCTPFDLHLRACTL